MSGLGEEHAEDIVKITKKYNEMLPEGMDEAGSCIVWALATVLEMDSRDDQVILQAGTMLWPRINEEDDDGVVNTHFGYKFEPEDPQSQARLRQCGLPEVHVWAARPSRKELIDFTTGYLPEQCKKLTGLGWPGRLPPPYFWGTRDELPDSRIVYRPIMNAIVMVVHFAKQYLREYMVEAIQRKQHYERELQFEEELTKVTKSKYIM